jgi:hypothetical protein
LNELISTLVCLSRVHGLVECSVAETVRDSARVVGTRRACMASLTRNSLMDDRRTARPSPPLQKKQS